MSEHEQKRNTDKRRIEKLEAQVDKLSYELDHVVKMLHKMSSAMGIPKSLLPKIGD